MASASPAGGLPAFHLLLQIAWRRSLRASDENGCNALRYFFGHTELHLASQFALPGRHAETQAMMVSGIRLWTFGGFVGHKARGRRRCRCNCGFDRVKFMRKGRQN